MNYQELKTRQRELTDRIDAIKRDFAQGLDADSKERAVQLQNAEVLNALMLQAQKELNEVNQKLVKCKE